MQNWIDSKLLTWHSLISIQYTPLCMLGNFSCCYIYSKDLNDLSNLQQFKMISSYTKYPSKILALGNFLKILKNCFKLGFHLYFLKIVS